MARSLNLHHICSQPDALRDEAWERTLAAALPESTLKLESMTPQTGPDGWPYLFATTAPGSSEPAVRVIDWLASRGIGLVLNAHKTAPDYIFTYGMIWNFKETGSFWTSSPAPEGGVVQFEKGEKVLAGPPSKEFLPAYVRDILIQFFKDQGVEDPKVLVLSRDKKHFDLCFSLESLGDPDPAEHQGIAEALAWFLPPHYSIMLASEKGLPKFYEMRETL
jgi:hypothetical protein